MFKSTRQLTAIAVMSFVPVIAMAGHSDLDFPAEEMREMGIDPKAEGAQKMAKAVHDRKTMSENLMEVTMHAVSEEGVGDSIGTVQVTHTNYGIVFDPDLSGLEAGIHGFHMHENASCGPTEKDGEVTAAGAAGGHYNPGGGSHNGPYEKGHKGDLPALYVNAKGEATVPVLAPRLNVADLAGHALIVHANGDNYSDEPKALGGGGGRVACGVLGEK
jgi:Cu-Zn family superoxide dismutase